MITLLFNLILFAYTTIVLGLHKKNKATRIKAPTLVLHDTGDQRVPITESFILYHILRDNGVKTKFIAYPVAGHNPSDPVHRRDRDRRWAAWLQEHLGANMP